jgi:type IV pilus assembly protein PilE
LPAVTAARASETERQMKNRGFTLIELLIVIVVVAILAAIAYPSFESSMRKSRRADAHAAIAAVQQAQERLRANCRFYAQTLGAANACGADAANTAVQAPATSSEQFYALSVRANSATGNAYVIEASPQGAQAADTACAPIVLTVGPASPNGERTPAGCW